MNGMQVVEVDPDDDAGLAAWLDVTGQAARHEVGDHAPMWSLPELVPMVREPDRTRRIVLLNGLLDGEVVATGKVLLRLLDNLDAAEVDAAVRPDVRRRGLGSLVLARAEEIARADGRSRFEAQTRWTYDGPPDGAGTSGVEFAKARGYHYGLGEVQRELLLPVEEERLLRLAAGAAPYHSDYRIRAWAGPVPDDLVEGWLALSTTLMTEAPAGEMQREPEAADVAAFRTFEAGQARQGRTPWHAVALDVDGEVVAYSQLMVPSRKGSFIFQWGTLVHRAHRGHRLGLAVKVANLQALQSGADVSGRRVVTWNAEVNDHMIGINEQLGFVGAARCAELQKTLA